MDRGRAVTDELPAACEKCGSALHFTHQHDECREALHAAVTPKQWKRANYVAAPHFYNLNQACAILNRCFEKGFGCYLVGSALTTKDYRDVDVRYIMDDESYDKLFKNDRGWTNPLWSVMCTSISLWLSKATDLPIDFQIQRQSTANAEHHGKRAALGIFLDYPGDRPSETKET